MDVLQMKSDLGTLFADQVVLVQKYCIQREKDFNLNPEMVDNIQDR